LDLAWLRDIFEPTTRGYTKRVYRLLILDSYRSHSTPEFDLFTKEQSIITLCIPPYSSHLLQPLDVSCFSGLKRSYRQELEQLIYIGYNYIDKSDFLAIYLAACKENITTKTSCSRFAATGLVLYNPDRVLSKLNTQLQTPTPLLPLQSKSNRFPKHLIILPT
jgi:hypothetical protein